MIRINLIAAKRKKQARTVPVEFILTALLTIFMVAMAGYLFYFLSSKIQTLTLKKQDNEKKIAQLRNTLKELENYESLIKDIEQKQRVIEELRRNQSVPVRVIDEISKLLPDSVWLNSLNIKGDTIHLSGSAFTNRDVVSYVNNLKSADLFMDVYLEESKNRSIPMGTGKETVSLYDFKLNMRIKV